MNQYYLLRLWGLRKGRPVNGIQKYTLLRDNSEQVSQNTLKLRQKIA